MNKVINAIWKYLDKLKGKWWSIAKIVLAIFILSISAYYLFWRFPSIIKGGERQIDTAIIAISAIIILLPFLSEIELFGVKFKKEIEQLEKETNEKLKSMDLKLLSIQSQNITQNFYQPKSDEELKKLSASAQEVIKDTTKNTTSTETFYQVPTKLVRLFSIRWKLRKTVIEVYKKLVNKNIDITKKPRNMENVADFVELNFYMSEETIKKINTQQLIEFLVKRSTVHSDIGEILQEIVAICDNAYFGHKVTEEQIVFVEENEYIIDHLETL